MPTFCRHSRLIQNCPICAREQNIELRPVVSSSAPKSSLPASGRRARRSARPLADFSGLGRPRATPGLTVRRLERGAEDGYHSQLVPGLKSSADAERLADELAFAPRGWRGSRPARRACSPRSPTAVSTSRSAAGSRSRSRIWARLKAISRLRRSSAAARPGIRRGAVARRARARAPHLARARPRHPHAGRVPGLGGARRLAGGGVHRRRGVDARAPLRAGVRAAGAPRPAPRRPV